MKTTDKIMIGGVIACIIGAILIDCYVLFTGTTLIILGVLDIMFAPFLVYITKQ